MDPNQGLTMKDKMIHPAPRAENTDTTSIAVLKVCTSSGLDGAERALMFAFQWSDKAWEAFLMYRSHEVINDYPSIIGI